MSTFTDDLPSYAAVLPQGAHFTGKSLTQKLESLNANVRHHLARFARVTVQVVGNSGLRGAAGCESSYGCARHSDIV